MTDFIHEHPKDESPASLPSPAPAEEPELDRRTGQRRVYGYIFILFIVSFSLLLWAFFMNQRGTDQVLSELRGSAGALQSTLERSLELERRNEELEEEIETLRARLRELEAETGELSRQAREADKAAAQLETARDGYRTSAAARGLLWLLEYRFASGELDLCRETARELEEFRDALLTSGNAGEPSELERYEEIREAVGLEPPAENDNVSRETRP